MAVVDTLEKNQLLGQGKIPSHIAIIMDGNGRWAQQRAMPRVYGHYKGLSSIRTCIRACAKLKVNVLTLYAFSEENWMRPRSEVDHIFSLIDHFILKDTESLKANNIRLRFIGIVGKLPKKTYNLIKESEKVLSNNTGMILNVALSYSSRCEIGEACKKIASQVVEGRISLEQISPSLVAKHLDTYDLSDPDLLIRTSGERRLSNFLLWQLAYAELYFTPVYWPNFKEEDLHQAIANYQKRQRRFGGLSEESEQPL